MGQRETSVTNYMYNLNFSDLDENLGLYAANKRLTALRLYLVHSLYIQLLYTSV